MTIESYYLHLVDTDAHYRAPSNITESGATCADCGEAILPNQIVVDVPGSDYELIHDDCLYDLLHGED